MNRLYKWFWGLVYRNKIIANTIQSKPDVRDFLVESSSYPEEYEIKHNVPIRSQGSISSCASHSAVRAIEIQLSLRNKFVEGSELYHYYMVRKHIRNDFPKDGGQTIRESMKGLSKFGLCPESAWSYDVKNINKEPHDMSKSLAQLMIRWFQLGYYMRMTTESQIKSKISEGYPVTFGLRIDDNYCKLRNKWLWTPGGRSRGGHAQILYKYDKEYFYIENSWGKRWGVNGRYKAKISDIMNKGFDFYIIKLKEEQNDK